MCQGSFMPRPITRFSLATAAMMTISGRSNGSGRFVMSRRRRDAYPLRARVVFGGRRRHPRPPRADDPQRPKISHTEAVPLPVPPPPLAMRLRVATFNLENFDEAPAGEQPSLQTRIGAIRPQLARLRADVLCLQEIHGQERPDQERQLLALDALFEGTPYAGFARAHTRTARNEAYDKRNLVIVSRFPIEETAQYRNTLVPEPLYRPVTARPEAPEAKEVRVERPILHARLRLPDGAALHVLNVHLKSRRPSDVEGQKLDRYTWRTASGWAEGAFISALKRVGQALEARVLIDQIFDREPEARIVMCGDFNAHPGEVPVETIAGRVENTGNAALRPRVLLSVEATIPEPARFTFIHQGQKRLLDHLLISQALLPFYRHAEIHNEALHDESVAFTSEEEFPEPDHAPFVAEFEI